MTEKKVYIAVARKEPDGTYSVENRGFREEGYTYTSTDVKNNLVISIAQNANTARAAALRNAKANL